MLKIYNLKYKVEYIREIAELTQKEWGEKTNTNEEFEEKVNKKIYKMINSFDNAYYCKLILLHNKKLVGFISIFEHDCDERKDLSPWYATMYVKEEYRNKGYAKALLDMCEKWAKAQGCLEFASDCELENVTSLKFHLRMGFEETNRIICFKKRLC